MDEESEDSTMLASDLVPYIGEILLDEGNHLLGQDTFVRHMQTIKPDYTVQDPRTWPRITASNFTNLLRPVQTRKSMVLLSPIPMWVAYDSCVLGELLNKDWAYLQSTSDLATRGFRSMTRFLNYPYNFDRKECQRSTPHFPKEDFEYWMTRVNGLDWQKKFPAADKEWTAVIEQPSEPATAYERIMKTLKEKKAASSQLKISDEELSAIRANAEQQTERANKAQSDLQKEQDLTKILQHKARTTRLQTSLTELRLRKANATIDRQKQAISEHDNAIRSKDSIIIERDDRIAKQDAEIIKLRVEVKDANDKMEEIWRVMSGTLPNTPKRTIIEEGSSKRPHKKTKTGGS